MLTHKFEIYAKHQFQIYKKLTFDLKFLRQHKFQIYISFITSSACYEITSSACYEIASSACYEINISNKKCNFVTILCYA